MKSNNELAIEWMERPIRYSDTGTAHKFLAMKDRESDEYSISVNLALYSEDSGMKNRFHIDRFEGDNERFNIPFSLEVAVGIRDFLNEVLPK